MTVCYKPEEETSSYKKLENLFRMLDNIGKIIKINKPPTRLSMVKFKNIKTFRKNKSK